jgi:uncharacterized repeat protein (TIGR02543 family)
MRKAKMKPLKALLVFGVTVALISSTFTNSASAAVAPTSAVLTGFASASTTTTKQMRADIKTLVAANPNATKVTCSANANDNFATASDIKLAKARAASVCHSAVGANSALVSKIVVVHYKSKSTARNKKFKIALSGVVVAPATFTVTYDGQGGSNDLNTASFTVGDDDLILPTSSKTGYAFDGWYTSADGGTKIGDDGDAFAPTATSTLYAHWVVASSGFTVTYDGNGGTPERDSDENVVAFGYVILPGATRDGYDFIGWGDTPGNPEYTGAEGESLTIYNNSFTLYAQWAQSSFSVTLDAAGGDVAYTSLTYERGDSAHSLPTPFLAGYNFTGWCAKAECALHVADGEPFAPTEDVAFVATWVPAPPVFYAVTYDAAGGTAGYATLSYASHLYPDGLPLPSWSRSGYTFDGWYDAAVGGNLIGMGNTTSSYTPSSDVTLYAHSTFVEVTYITYGDVYYLQGVQPDCGAYTGMAVQVWDSTNTRVLSASGTFKSDYLCDFGYLVEVPAGDYRLVLTIITSHPEYFTSNNGFVSSGATASSVVLSRTFTSGLTNFQQLSYITPAIP